MRDNGSSLGEHKRVSEKFNRILNNPLKIPGYQIKPASGMIVHSLLSVKASTTGPCDLPESIY